MDWFESQCDTGIYSNRNVLQLIPRPYCYDDKSIIDSHTFEFLLYDDSFECLLNNSVAFTVQLILLKLFKSDTISCHHHGSLQIKNLSPDLVSNGTVALLGLPCVA